MSLDLTSVVKDWLAVTRVAGNHFTGAGGEHKDEFIATKIDVLASAIVAMLTC